MRLKIFWVMSRGITGLFEWPRGLLGYLRRYLAVVQLGSTWFIVRQRKKTPYFKGVYMKHEITHLEQNNAKYTRLALWFGAILAMFQRSWCSLFRFRNLLSYQTQQIIIKASQVSWREFFHELLESRSLTPLWLQLFFKEGSKCTIKSFVC